MIVLKLKKQITEESSSLLLSMMLDAINRIHLRVVRQKLRIMSGTLFETRVVPAMHVHVQMHVHVCTLVYTYKWSHITNFIRHRKSLSDVSV